MAGDLLGGTGPAGGVELGAFLLVGLLGGAHCLGMCGPLVSLYADRLGAGRGSDTGGRAPLTLFEVRQHALFNLGRTASYATIGAGFGLLGGLLYDASALAAVADVVRAVAGVVVGLAVLLVGARYLAGRQGDHLPVAAGPFERVSAALTDRVDDWVEGPRIVGLGAVHGLLPCPLLYPAFLYAFARGSPVAGAITLGVLGAGTFPTLFLYGTAVGSLGATRRATLHRALGVAFLLMGWIPLTHGLALLGLPVPHVPLPHYQPLG